MIAWALPALNSAEAATVVVATPSSQRVEGFIVNRA
jgi:hypothetical protein